MQTSNWLENAYVEDVITLDVSPFTPPLEAGYNLEVALFDVHTLEALSVINLSGNPQDVNTRSRRFGTDLSKGKMIRMICPYLTKARERLFWSKRRSCRMRPPSAMSCDSAGLGRKPTMARPALQLDFFGWQRVGRRHMFRGPCPWLTGYDIAQWRVGEVFRGHHRLLVPPDLPPGQYALGVQLLDATGNPAAATITLDATMEVAVPPRQFDRPVLDFSVGVVWDNGLVLHGNRSGESGELHLVWGTRRPLPESLRLFVHLLDEQDLIAAQWDGVPVDWSRPTTSWLPDEYVTTSHRFDLPAGQYRIRLGWYDPVSGERVSVGDGDAFQLREPFRIE